ncbi:MAG: RecQ family ATP-dependent DNA helicase [Thermomicrobiales bacterium]|nr:RecQ family ATP-dependent DNA helicase [Thermomicrobiales bacterium]
MLDLATDIICSPEEPAALPANLQRRLARWHRERGDLAAAEAMLDLIEARAGRTATLLEERAAVALLRDDEEAVHALWTERLALSGAPTARASYAHASIELGDLGAAATILAELTDAHPEMATVRTLAADLSLARGDWQAARQILSAQVAADPAAVYPRLGLARLALATGDAAAVRDRLHDVLVSEAPLSARQLTVAAALADTLGQRLRAATLRQRIVQTENERAHKLAADIAEALGREPSRFSPVETSSGPEDNGRAASAESGPDEPAAPRFAAPPELASVVASGLSARPAAAPPAPIPLVAEEVVANPRVLEMLRTVFGHERLRTGQAAAINRALAGRDALAVLPTGAGKSLVYQIAALLLPGVTLVLSPLIALMRDQAEGLPPELRERTAVLNSTLSQDEQRDVLRDIAAGRFELVYAAPERLRSHAFLRALRQAGTSLVVVDEAHCISLWGHDFRPDYLSIPAALPALGGPPLLALTATASPETAAALAAGFDRRLEVVRASGFRPNLFYRTERLPNREAKARRLVELCRELRGSGIVYVSSRRDVENLAGVLNDNGVRAAPYHAGLPPEVRTRNQDAFMHGEARVVVATIAFGMGIDKSDVRFVIHFSPSTSLESYAQESGRAGRDGQRAECVLLYTSADRATQTRLARRDELNLDQLRDIYRGVSRHTVGRWAIFDPSAIALTPKSGDDPADLPDPRIGIALLEMGRLLRRHPHAPAGYQLRPTLGLAVGPENALSDPALWERFVAHAGIDPEQPRPVAVQTAETCEALDIAPEDLAALLEAPPGWAVQEGARLPCLELLPAGRDAGARLNAVLAEAGRRARERVDKVMDYADGGACRHVDLAAHLGERLEPCGSACDICTGTVRGDNALPPGERRRAARTATKKRAVTTQADARAVLEALHTAPFPVGKTGLTRLLEGSVTSRIQADRSRHFGALADLSKSRIEGIVDDLVEAGDLAYDRSGKFPVLALTPEGVARVRNGRQ